MISEKMFSRNQTLKGRRILLIDDCPDSLELLQQILEEEGASVDVANRARDGIERAIKAAPYDAILMDIQMPEMTGYEAALALRKTAYKGPIVALTANSMKDEQERCLAAGFDSYLSKPFKFHELIKTICNHIHAKG